MYNDKRSKILILGGAAHVNGSAGMEFHCPSFLGTFIVGHFLLLSTQHLLFMTGYIGICKFDNFACTLSLSHLWCIGGFMPSSFVGPPLLGGFVPSSFGCTYFILLQGWCAYEFVVTPQPASPWALSIHKTDDFEWFKNSTCNILGIAFCYIGRYGGHCWK